MRRWPSVTARHIKFLFGQPKDGAMYAREEVRDLAEGDWDLPTTDDDKVGEEV